jgi:hypothetical protein
MTSTAKSYRSSGYPLRVLEQAAAESEKNNQSSYLKGLISGSAKSSVIHLRVSPMKNPYPAEPKPVVLNAESAKSMGLLSEETRRAWFRIMNGI